MISCRVNQCDTLGTMTSETRWLSTEESAAWVRLVALAELLPTALDAQLLRDAGLTHFEYGALMALAGAPDRTMRMTELAARTNATLPRLSHVARRLEERGLIRRFPCPTDRRATNATVTDAGLDLIDQAAPGHVDTVRANVLDALTPDQLGSALRGRRRDPRAARSRRATHRHLVPVQRRPGGRPRRLTANPSPSAG
jgi:DNA-binding MarR family transcriptional regulator